MAVQKYEIYKDVTGKFRFRLRAPNNKIVAVGEAYETKDSCLNGVHAIKEYCGAEIEDQTTGEADIANPKFQVYKDAAEKYRFRLRVLNNKIVAVGEAYESKSGCMNGVQAVKKYCDAEVKDLTTEQILEEPTREVPKDTVVEGEGVAGAKIDIYESDRSFMKDDYMASGHTLEDGTFSIDWKAKETDWWDNTVEVYAKFEGTASHKPSRSKQYVITVWSSKILGGSQL